MLNVKQYEDLILTPVLSAFQSDNPGWRTLITGTMAHESLGGTYIKQIQGPALGICQMEPQTHDSIWASYMPNQPALTHQLMTLCMFSRVPKATQMINDMLYATAMCVIFYKWRLEAHKERPPSTLEESAAVWKHYYNTNLGKGTLEEFVNDYKKFTGTYKKSDTKKEV